MNERSFTSGAAVRLGDVGRDGRMRLAALARHLQDVAHDDVEDAGLGRTGNWVVRRLELDVLRMPKFGERIGLETMCAGVGPRWAERLTHVRGHDGSAGITARALWVFVDRDGRPRQLPAQFHELYPVPEHRSRISPKLRHPLPPPSVVRSAWRLRASDFDLLGHMNNAAYWDPVDDELANRPDAPLRRAEMEFRGGIDPGEPVVVATDRAGGDEEVALWLEVGGSVRASARVWQSGDGAARDE